MELIEARDLAKWLDDDAQPNPVLLDVRELSEIQICHIPNSIHMPLHSLSVRINELDKATPIVCICHHGMRSMQAARYLEQSGFDRVVNLNGGIHAWATQVDQKMETY